jgi:hypothetical protein
MLIASKRLTFSGNNIGTVKSLPQSTRFLQQTNNIGNLINTDFGFIYLESMKAPSFSQQGIELLLNPANIQASGPTYLGNSHYAIHSQTIAPIDLLLNETGGLYGYGRAMLVLLFLATVVFMGQQLLYKTDNIFITFSVLYLILPSANLAPSASAFACYSFLYGFAWSSYL